MLIVGPFFPLSKDWGPSLLHWAKLKQCFVQKVFSIIYVKQWVWGKLKNNIFFLIGNIFSMHRVFVCNNVSQDHLGGLGMYAGGPYLALGPNVAYPSIFI